MLPRGLRRAILAQARAARPRECCGLLLGRGRHVQCAVPARNLADSAQRFELDPRLHIDIRRLIRTWVPPLEIVGAYHSHPRGRPEPSASDIAESYYPDWVHVIAGRSGGRSRLAAWRIRQGRAAPVRLAWPAKSRR